MFGEHMVSKKDRDLLDRAKRALGLPRDGGTHQQFNNSDPEQMNRVAAGPNAFNL